MDLKRRGWLIICIAVVIMTMACFAPALDIGRPVVGAIQPAGYLAGETIPGGKAAVLSAIATFLGIVDFNGNHAALIGCAAGLLANVVFLTALLGLMLRQIFGWKRPRHRGLSLRVYLGTLSAIGSFLWLYPAANYVGAWLWLIAQATFAYGLWILPEPEGKRGFEVIAVRPPASTAPPVVGNQSQNPI